MRFLVDMNLSPRWVDFLAAAGHEAAHWSDVGAPDAPGLHCEVSYSMHFCGVGEHGSQVSRIRVASGT